MKMTEDGRYPKIELIKASREIIKIAEALTGWVGLVRVLCIRIKNLTQITKECCKDIDIRCDLKQD